MNPRCARVAPALLVVLLACRPPAPGESGAPEAVPTGEGLFEQGCPVAGESRARRLEAVSERPWGEDALAAPGDVLLLNERAAFVVQGPDDPRTYYHYGGMPIDAVAVEGCEQAGPERMEEVGFVVGKLDLAEFTASSLHQVRGDRIEVVADGRDGGPAVVEVHATDDRFWLVELTLLREAFLAGDRRTLGDPFGLDLTLRYTLDPGATALQMDVVLDGEVVDDGFLVGTLVFPSDRTPVSAWASSTLSVGGFGLTLGAPWMSAGGSDGSTAIAAPGASLSVASISGVTALVDANQAAVPLEVNGQGEPPVVPFLLGVGPTDAASASAGFEPYLDAPLGETPTAWIDVSGQVLDPRGEPVPGASITITADGGAGSRVFERLVAGADGSFAGRTLDPGVPWTAVASHAGRDDSVPWVGKADAAGSIGTLTVGAAGAVAVVADDGEGGLLPVRVELERDDGALVVAFPLPGDEPVPVPPGHWRAWVSRGFEHALATAEIDVPEDGTAELAVTLPRVVDTTGWASFDSHVHAELSADSGTLAEARVRTVAASGLDAFVSTDHEAIVDLSYALAAVGAEDLLGYALGSEVTATVPEHINAWPFPVRADDERGDPVRWQGMGFPGIYEAIRDRGARVVQLNHSRVNGECGILCVADWDRRTDPPALSDPEALGLPAGTALWSWDFDSFEVMNGNRSPFLEPDDPRRSGALEDWFAFHNLGYPVTGVAVTDVHGLGDPGSPRTYARAEGAADALVDALADAVLGGHAQMSAGAFARVTLGDAGPGDLGVPGVLRVEIQALPEIDVTRVEVLRNCDHLATLEAADPGGVVKLDTTVEIEGGSDAWLVVVAMGEGGMPRGLEDYDAATVPRVVTNPLFVDGDGDGTWTPPGPKACDTTLP